MLKFSSLNFSPDNQTLPELAGESPLSSFNMVDLAQPDGPSITINSPYGISKVDSCGIFFPFL